MLFRSLLAVLLLTSSAFAEPKKPELQKFDFTQVLIGRDKKPIMECVKLDDADRNKCAEQAEVTLGWLVSAALDQPKQGQIGGEKFKRGKLSLRVYDAKDAELTGAEVGMIVTALGEFTYRTSAIAVAVALIDPVEAAK